MTRHEHVRSLVDALVAIVHRMLGERSAGQIVWGITVSDLAASLILLAGTVGLTLAVRAMTRSKHAGAAGGEVTSARARLLREVRLPLEALIWLYGGYLAALPLLPPVAPTGASAFLQAALDKVFDLGAVIMLLWLGYRATYVLESHLGTLASRTQSKVDDLFAPLVGSSLRLLLPVLGLAVSPPLLKLTPGPAGALAKLTSVLLIGAAVLIAVRVVRIAERALLLQFDVKVSDNLRARKVATQVHVLARAAYVLVSLFGAASVLMLFEQVRQFGTSILASAGVVGIIIGFAAQKTISNLFAGFQVALTQPIRLDDVVIVEGEWGKIEEISLTYVVIRIWDDRRLVVPLGYFIDKPFQNWTRQSAEILGVVTVWSDYSLPLEEAREALRKIIEPHPQWDGRFWNLQVTDASQSAMQIRVLATSADSSKNWDLRCDIREGFIRWIQANHPGGLPRVRAELARPPGTDERT